MRLIIEIDTSNDAFQPDPYLEVTRLLLVAAVRTLMHGKDRAFLYDLNGNTVGSFSYGP